MAKQPTVKEQIKETAQLKKQMDEITKTFETNKKLSVENSSLRKLNSIEFPKLNDMSRQYSSKRTC